MKLWQRILIPTLIAMLIAGVYLFIVFKSREDPGLVKHNEEPAKPLTADESVFLKQYLYATFDQAKDLEGRTVWVKAGFALPYYPYAGGTVAFAKRVGVLPSAEKMQISKLIKAVAPAKEEDRVPHGSRQYFVVFTLPDPKSGKAGTFAAPVGYAEEDNEAILADQLFFYDDPRTLYSFWPKPVWDAIDAHTPIVGMTENQVRMAVGILLESGSTTQGDRTVAYVAGPKTWTVTFAHDKATAVKAG